ncbi:MAG: hypothetical protein RDU01_06325 [Thermodesulfovibrionales bacterium]|nr:hypothetical protein [Thermodesulfovibrionales bacterium]
MRAEYAQKFRLFGLVELRYTDFHVETTSSGSTISRGSTTFQQYYKLGAEGYIYHPRLAVFTASIAYNDTKFNPERGINVTTKDFTYDITTTFLPYRPVAFDLYARKIDYTFNLAGDPVDTSSNLYGARLRINKRRWPATRVEYYHWDYELLRFGNTTDKVTEDRFTLDVRGRLNPFSTKYQLMAEHTSISKPHFNDKILNARINFSSILRPGIYFYNWLSYIKSNYYKNFSFSTNLYFTPWKRFQHNYSYEYIKADNELQGNQELGAERKTIKTKTETILGSWGYRFTERMSSALSLRYTRNEENGVRWDAEGISTSIGYARPISWMKFASYYRFLLRQDERRGNFQEHNVEINVSTSKFRWGILYGMYVFNYIDETQKYMQKTGADDFFDEDAEMLEKTSETFTHLFRLGVRGRIPGRELGRAYWNVETEYFKSDTSGRRPARVYDEYLGSSGAAYEDYDLHFSQWSVTGNLSYPFRRGIVLTFKTGYRMGESNDKKRTSYFYESRLVYPISRRLGIVSWWRHVFTELEGSQNSEERLFQIEADYKLGRTYIVFEGRIRNILNDGERYDRILTLRARRSF